MSIKMTGTNPDPNGGAFQRADVDPALTRSVEDGPLVQTSTANDTVGKSGSDTLGNIREFYAADNVEEIDQDPGDQGATAPGHSPNTWVGEDDNGVFRGASPYRNQGLSGPKTDRGYLDNQG